MSHTLSTLYIRRRYLQVLVEPANSLGESLLLGELVVLVAEVGTDSEAVGDAAVQVDLPVLAGLGEDILGLVAQLGGEDLVDFLSLVSITYRVKRMDNSPEAQMDRGPETAPSSSSVTNEGWAV